MWFAVFPPPLQPRSFEKTTKSGHVSALQSQDSDDLWSCAQRLVDGSTELGDGETNRYSIHQIEVLAWHVSREQTMEGLAAQPGLIDYSITVGEWALLHS